MLTSFRTQLMLSLGGLALIVSLGLIIYVDSTATAQLAQASRNRIASVSQAIAHTLSTSISERKRTIVLLSQMPTLTPENFESDPIEHQLDRLQKLHPEYAWIGIADTKGTVRNAADALLEGKTVREREWFTQGLKGPYLGDVHEAVLLANLLPNGTPEEPLRFIDFVAPITDPQGRVVGLLAAHAHWTWVKGIIKETLDAETLADGIEVFIISRNDEILYPQALVGEFEPPDLSTSASEQNAVAWPDGGLFLTSENAITTKTQNQLGWRVIVRQPIKQALLPVEQLRKRLALFGLLTVLAALLIAYLLARRISDPIEKLHRAARKIQSGDEQAIVAQNVNAPLEIRELYRAFHDMTLNLLQRKKQVEQVNASLEQTVNQRTAQLQEANEHLEQLARRDPLTGLYNRLAATERLDQEFVRFKRSTATYAVLMIDIDHFKRVNDTHGHHVGDTALQACAQLLQGQLRQSDFIARFGGEEFIAILPDTGPAGALETALKIRDAVANARLPIIDTMTLSIGIATAHDEQLALNSLEIVREADNALYQAKANGRNRVEMFNSPATTDRSNNP